MRTSAVPRVPKNILNEYGGNIGGPIKKDKLFFFFNYDKVAIRQYKNNNTFSVPLTRFRNGDFSSILGGTTGKAAARKPERESDDHL